MMPRTERPGTASASVQASAVVWPRSRGAPFEKDTGENRESRGRRFGPRPGRLVDRDGLPLDRVEQLNAETPRPLLESNPLPGSLDPPVAFLVAADVYDGVRLLGEDPPHVELEDRVESWLGLRRQLDLERDRLVGYEADQVGPVSRALKAVPVEPVELARPVGIIEDLPRSEIGATADFEPGRGPGAGAVVRPRRRRRRGGGDQREAENADALPSREEQRAGAANHRAPLEPAFAFQPASVVPRGDLAPAHRIPPRM